MRATAISISCLVMMFLAGGSAFADSQTHDCCDAAARPLDCPNGASCCEDTTWQCNDEAGWSTCPADGTACSCGGIAGGTCAEGEYCYRENFESLDDCYQVADLAGVCTLTTPDCSMCNITCGCNGITYQNACSAQAVTDPHFFGACGSEVRGVVFGHPLHPTWMIWRQQEDALAYNVYRKVYEGVPPTDLGSCLLANYSPQAAILDDPEPGELWFLSVTAVYPTGEGAPGRQGGPLPCIPKVIADRCDE